MVAEFEDRVQTSVLLAQCAHAIIMSCVAFTWKTYINLYN